MNTVALREPLNVFLKEIEKYPVLSKEEEYKIAVSYYEEKDLKAANTAAVAIAMVATRARISPMVAQNWFLAHLAASRVASTVSSAALAMRPCSHRSASSRDFGLSQSGLYMAGLPPLVGGTASTGATGAAGLVWVWAGASDF